MTPNPSFLAQHIHSVTSLPVFKGTHESLALFLMCYDDTEAVCCRPKRFKVCKSTFQKINKIIKSEDKVTQIPSKAVVLALDTFTLHYIIHTVLYNFTESICR